ncbi:MAG: CHAT domain-containing protein [Roseiflexaceae bacterium]
MPIPMDKLDKNFVVAAPNATIGELLGQLPKKRTERAWFYIVQQATNRRYYVLLWKEVEEIGRAMGGELRNYPFKQLDNLPLSVEAVEQSSMGEQAANGLRLEQPGRRLVVLANGQVIGLLADVLREATPIGDDPFAPSIRAIPFDAEVAEAFDTVEPPALPPEPGTLGAEGEAVSQPDNRVVNAWVSDVDGASMKDQPLQVGTAYDLKFNVDAPKKDAISTAMIDVPKLFASLPPEQQTVEVLVVIETDDFTINGPDQQPIVVPRTGRSKNTATFNIEPKRNGAGVIRAFFLANNRMFQKMTITLQVGPLQADKPAILADIKGLTMASAMSQPLRRDEHPINLMIIKKEAGYQFILQGVGATRAFLNLSETQLAELVGQMREMFKGIVFTLAGNQYVYQLEDTNIPPDIHAATLKIMAKQGTLMYDKLFYGPGSGPDARAMGDLLRKLSREHQLHIEIVAERFTFPWALLYDHDDLKPDLSNVDPEGFWGLKHEIEYTPEFASATPVNFVSEITVKDKLGFSFVCNTTIDAQMKRPIIVGQREFLESVPGISLTEHPTIGDLYALLNNPDSPAQVVYFYCHAVSNLPGEKGGVGGSKIVLSDGAATLDDLNFAAPLDGTTLKSAPLVFLNCCQSAELSPYLYDGLVPYLITKGARGVVGTEVDTPALFAAEFAKQFITRFVAGDQKLGDVLLDLRREYLLNKNNVMGLVYALHSSGEIYVNRGLSVKG